MDRLDPDWLEQQYDNRARVPDHAQYFERWARESAIVRERVSRRIDMAYGPSPAETLDVFPAPHDGAPVLFFIHGGWWRSLDKSDFSFLAPCFTREGAMVVIPNYGLAPDVSLETIALQMVQALAWTWRHARLYGGDPQRVVVAGHSAGGHLAAMLLTCRWRLVGTDLPERLVRGALSISGLFDLEPIRHTPSLQADLHLTPESVGRLSPLHLPAPKAPLYATVGENESEAFIEQGEAIRQAWGEDGVPVCETVANSNHFDVVDELGDPHGRLHGLALRLLGLSV